MSNVPLTGEQIGLLRRDLEEGRRERVVGFGEDADVYKVDEKAVKMFKERLVGCDSLETNFNREKRMHKQIHGTGTGLIPDYHGSGQITLPGSRKRYITMEFIEGSGFAEICNVERPSAPNDMIQEGLYDMVEVDWRIGVSKEDREESIPELLEELDEIDSAGFVLNPFEIQNILFTDEGIRILDLCLSRENSESPYFTRVGDFDPHMGTWSVAKLYYPDNLSDKMQEVLDEGKEAFTVVRYAGKRQMEEHEVRALVG